MVPDSEVDEALRLEEAIHLERSLLIPQQPEESDDDDDEALLEATLQFEAQRAISAEPNVRSLGPALQQGANQPTSHQTGLADDELGGFVGDEDFGGFERPGAQPDGFATAIEDAGSASSMAGCTGQQVGVHDAQHEEPVCVGQAGPLANDIRVGTGSPSEVFAQRLKASCGGDRIVVPRGVVMAGKPCCIRTGASRHSSTICGVEVLFPFPCGPLQPQQQIMQRVIEGLASRKHAVLESPTGTGKTAAVLCAALAWQRQQKAKAGSAPQIMFVSRTHAQLRQAVAELARTPYKPTMVVIGSRESGLCVYPPVCTATSEIDRDQLSIRQSCREARRTAACTFHSNLRETELAEQAVSRLRSGEPWDIEEIASFGRNAGGCPYYMAHGLSQYAELVFCPYSYIFDPSVRKSAGMGNLELHGRVVIVDEAHNAEGVCRDAGSAELSVDHMRGALAALKRALGDAGDQGSGPQNADASSFRQDAAAPTKPKPSAARRRTAPKAEELGGFLAPSIADLTRSAPGGDSFALNSADNTSSASTGPRRFPQVSLKDARPLRGLIALLGRLCSFVTEAREPMLFAPHYEAHRQVPTLFRQLKLDAEPMLRPGVEGCSREDRIVVAQTRGEEVLRDLLAKGVGGPSVAPILELASNLLAQLAAAVKLPGLYVVRVDPVETRALTLWLMAPEGTVGPLADELHSLMLMSGTLAPVSATVAELGPTFGKRVLPPVEAGHVVGRRALKFMATGHVESTKLECTFHAWKREPFLLAVGAALLTIVQSIPSGILVFVPSYDLLERCIRSWRHPGGPSKKRRGAVERVRDVGAVVIWDQLVAAKETLVVEPPPQNDSRMPEYATASTYAEAKQQYEDAIRSTGRALLLAVFRGRMSEGVSFDDDFARGVVCIGIPFPNLKEERLAQKRACNDFWLAKGQGAVSGDSWYECRALQAVAQALGRCIRHPRDYGALVLLDSRWVELGKAAGLPRWLQPFFEGHPNVLAAAGSLREHFSAASRDEHMKEVQGQSQRCDPLPPASTSKPVQECTTEISVSSTRTAASNASGSNVASVGADGGGRGAMMSFKRRLGTGGVKPAAIQCIDLE